MSVKLIKKIKKKLAPKRRTLVKYLAPKRRCQTGGTKTAAPKRPVSWISSQFAQKSIRPADNSPNGQFAQNVAIRP